MENVSKCYEKMTNARIFLKYIIKAVSAEDGAIKSAFLYSHYVRWVKENRYQLLSSRAFGKEVRKIFRKSKRKRGGTRAERFYYHEGLAFVVEEICGESTVDKSWQY